MKKQTAVEWYYQQTIVEGKTNYAELLEQALTMEKEQTIQFGYDILIQADEKQNGYVNVEEYYNETYKGGNNE